MTSLQCAVLVDARPSAGTVLTMMTDETFKHKCILWEHCAAVQNNSHMIYLEPNQITVYINPYRTLYISSFLSLIFLSIGKWSIRLKCLVQCIGINNNGSTLLYDPAMKRSYMVHYITHHLFLYICRKRLFQESQKSCPIIPNGVNIAISNIDISCPSQIKPLH